MRTPATAQILAQVASNTDETLENRYQAMMGTYEWCRGEHDEKITDEERANAPQMPGMSLFMSHPQRYLKEWSAWWAQEGSSPNAK
jgi:hypothetical protein